MLGVCLHTHNGRPCRNCTPPCTVATIMLITSETRFLRQLGAMPSGRPLHTTSMRRASRIGASRFIAATATLRPTRAPASWQDPRNGSLQGQHARGQNTGRCTGGPVIASNDDGMAVQPQAMGGAPPRRQPGKRPSGRRGHTIPRAWRQP